MPQSIAQLCVLLLGLVVSTSEAIPAGRRQTDSTVDLGYAVYRGAVNTTTNIESFKGIRYVAAPVGESNRHRRPAKCSIDLSSRMAVQRRSTSIRCSCTTSPRSRRAGCHGVRLSMLPAGRRVHVSQRNRSSYGGTSGADGVLRRLSLPERLCTG